MSATRHCWRCRTHYPADTLVCVRCGVNLLTGEDIAKPDESAEVPLTGAAKLHALAADLMPGLLRPRIWAPVIALFAVAVGVALLGWNFMMGAPLSAISIMAVGFILYAQAVVWLMTGQFWLLHAALAEFQSRHWPIFLLLTFGPGVILLTLVKLLAHGR